MNEFFFPSYFEKVDDFPFPVILKKSSNFENFSGMEKVDKNRVFPEGRKSTPLKGGNTSIFPDGQRGKEGGR